MCAINYLYFFEIWNGSDYLSSDQEWDKVRRPPDGSANAQPANNFESHPKLPANNMKEFPFLRANRSKFDQVAKNHDSSAGNSTYKNSSKYLQKII